MSAAHVSAVIPALDGHDAGPILRSLATFFHTTGLEVELIVVGPRDHPASSGETVAYRFVSATGYGASLRKAVQEANGDVVLIVDPDLPYPVSTLGDLVALIHSEAADIVYGTVGGQAAERAPLLARWLLVSEVPDDRLLLKGFSAAAARLLFSESKLAGEGLDLELAFLANKYAFRTERLVVSVTNVPARSGRVSNGRIGDVIRIRLTNRQMAYRAALRCPICFSSEVWTHAQIARNLIRICMRCKCRYVARFWDDQEIAKGLQRKSEERDSDLARQRTGERRLAALRREVPAQARLLEIGAGDGLFGSIAGRDFEYVGIDSSGLAARDARSRGIEVYCSTLGSFVNTGAAFDAIAIFGGFEGFADPHDALGRVKELLKPGGVLIASVVDTESLLYLLTERKLLADRFGHQRILYSRSAMIELLEHSGFEIISVSGEVIYRQHARVESITVRCFPRLGRLVSMALRPLKDPLLVPSGSIRIIARRRVGPTFNVRAIRSIEPTHAR